MAIKGWLESTPHISIIFHGCHRELCCARSNGFSYSLTPAGIFNFAGVALEPGNNSITAIAVDQSGKASLPSDAISVLLAPAYVPDIGVADGDVTIIPAVPKPGEDVVVSAIVTNFSQIQIDNVPVAVYLWDAAGQLRLLKTETLPQMAPLSSIEIDTTITGGLATGTDSVIVVVDPENSIKETVESNNVATKEFFVTAYEGVSLLTSLDAPQYNANQNLLVHVAVRNSGWQAAGSLAMTVEDADGNVVAQIDQTSVTVPYGVISDYSRTWNTGATFAGAYQLHAAFTGADGVVAESRTPFQILPDLRVDAAITTDKQKYAPQQTVDLSVAFKNSGVNYIVPSFTARIRIAGQDKAMIFSGEQTAVNVMPGATGSFQYAWNTKLTTPGLYNAIVDIYSGDRLVTTAATTFTILPHISVNGLLTTDLPVVSIGRKISAIYMLANNGNVGTTGTAVISLIDPDSLTVVESTERPITIPIEATISGAVEFPSAGLSNKKYLIRLQYLDLQGDRTIASIPVTIRDILPPMATILAPVEGATYTRNVAFSALLSDDASGIEKAEYAMDNGPWQLLPPVDPTKGKYGALWAPVPRDQGLHTVRFRGTDRAGNVSTPVQVSFTVIVDTTPPSLQITAPSDGSYTGSETLRVTGTVTDETGVQTLSINSETVAVQADGSFNHAILLNTGPNVITITATDLVGNVATVTRHVTYDNTPPVTAITVGLPQYIAADGTLYIIGSTPVTLSAKDDAAGVQKTEYRIDSGAWLTYTPFVIPIEGSHVITYRSTDAVGNMESEKVLKVIVDDSAPVAATTVGNPQYTASGNLYVSRKTAINITATDKAAGVKTIEYSIDGGPFAAYGEPFTLGGYVEGSHTIAYRSTDNLSNLETLKQLSLILDGSTPTTTIEGSDPLVQGVVNTVAPVTVFTLAATDALSGVKEIWYRFGEDQWQLYNGPFTLAGLKAGSHTITYGAVDNVENAELQQTITVRLVSLETQKEIATEPVVLLFSGKDHDRYDEEHGEHKEADRLIALLDSIKISYYHARDEEDYRLARRSGRYNIYLLTDEGEKETGAEIREALYYGDGVLFIKTRPESDDKLSDIFGVKFTGKSTSRDLVVDIPEGPLGASGTLQSAGKTAVTTITSGTAKILGMVADKHGRLPAIIHNEYGRGKALLMTFNLADSPDSSKAADFLAKALHLLKPQEHYLRPLCSVPVTIQIGNSTEPLGIEVEETIPASTTVDTITPPVDPVEGIITWRQYLGGSERLNLGYYLNLPDAKGEYTTSTVVRYGNYGAYRLYGRSERSFTLTNDSAGLMQSAINDLLVLPVKEKKDRKRVDKALSELYRVLQETVDRDQAEDNLERILEAAEEVAELTQEAKELRVKLDELMKIWQRKWYLLQNGHPKEIENDDKNEEEDDRREADGSRDRTCEAVKLD